MGRNYGRTDKQTDRQTDKRTIRLLNAPRRIFQARWELIYGQAGYFAFQMGFVFLNHYVNTVKYYYLHNLIFEKSLSRIYSWDFIFVICRILVLRFGGHPSLSFCSIVQFSHFYSWSNENIKVSGIRAINNRDFYVYQGSPPCYTSSFKR